MEFADVTVKESPGLCRCCLSEGCYKDLGSEYSWMNDTEVYADMLLDCFDIGITQHNDGPNGPKRLICEVCITRLRDACNFKKQVVDSEKKFIDMLGRGEFRGREQQTVLLPMYTNAGALKAEAIEEVNLNEDYDDTNVEYLEDVSFTEDDEAVKAEVEPTPSTSTRRGRPRKTDVSETPEKKPKLKSKTKVAKGSKICLETDRLCNKNILAESSKLHPKLKIKDIKKAIAFFINVTHAMPFKFFQSRFRCFYCSKEFILCEDLKQHTKKVHPICETTFTAMKLTNLSSGVKVKIDTTSLMCKMCQLTFDDFASAVDHLELKHDTNRALLDILQPFKLIHEKFPCPLCNSEYRSFPTLLRHHNSGHPNLFNCICPSCGQQFLSEMSLRSHMMRYHDTHALKCPDCDVMFPTRDHLKYHRGKVHGRKIYSCKTCDEKFVSSYRLTLHSIEMHNGGHRCQFCDAVFIKYSFMSNHVRRLHLKEKNVECPLCNLRFFDNNRLKVHMVKHVGEKTYKCDTCAKSFLRKKNLVSHMTLHRKNGGG